MPGDLTDFQVALLCAIEEHDDSESTSDQKRDLARLIADGYVRRTSDGPGSAFALTAKGAAFLGEKKLQGSLMGSNRFPVDMPRFVDMYMAGKLKLDNIISQRIKLEDVNEGFEEMKKG